jgi:hypothetical protein
MNTIAHQTRGRIAESKARRHLLGAAALLALGLGCNVAPAAAQTDINACTHISQPGSYRLTQNLVHVASKQSPDCLRIGANDVTIDLGGFSLIGDGFEGGAGIIAQFFSGMSNIEIRNGTIRSFGSGISLIGVKRARVHNVRVLDNKLSGIAVGSAAIVSASTAVGNGGSGIATGVGGKGGSLVTGNVVSENGGHGISVDRFSTVRENIANANGFEGLNIECPSLVAENTALDNKSPFLQKNMNLIGAGCRVSVSNLAPVTIK